MSAPRVFLLVVFFILALPAAVRSADLEFPQRQITRIGFGSCAKHDLPTNVFNSAAHSDIDAWMWLGDIVYADKMTVHGFVQRPVADIKALYDYQKRRPEYEYLRTKLGQRATGDSKFSAKFDEEWKSVNDEFGLIGGVYDDHDYGINNGGARNTLKRDVQRFLLDFLDEPARSGRFTRDGAYVSYRWGGGPGLENRRVKVILLDVRYFREDPGPHADMLGTAQWEWLERELRARDAEVTIIGSGIQVFPDDKPIQEKWGNFPASRDRLLSLLKEASDHTTVALLSGDVHLAELFEHSCISEDYAIPEMTTSGITHAMSTQIGAVTGRSALLWMLNGPMLSRYHVPSQEYFIDFNFGVVEIDWDTATVGASSDAVRPAIDLTVHDENGTAVRHLHTQPAPGQNIQRFQDPTNPHCHGTDLSWRGRLRLFPIDDGPYFASRFLMAILISNVLLCLCYRKRRRNANGRHTSKSSKID